MTESATSLSQVGFMLRLFADPPKQVAKARRTFAQQVAAVAARYPRPLPPADEGRFAKLVPPEKWALVAEVPDPATGRTWFLYRTKSPGNMGVDGVLWTTFKVTVAEPDMPRTATRGRPYIPKRRAPGSPSFVLGTSAQGFAEGAALWALAAQNPWLLAALVPHVQDSLSTNPITP